LRILYIEDNETAQEYVKRGLLPHGIQVDVCRDGIEALDRGQNPSYAMIVLGLELPSADGFTVLQQISKIARETPIPVLSARSPSSRRAEDSDPAANASLPKSVVLAEMVGRIRAILRRVPVEGDYCEMRVGDLVLDASRRVVMRSGKPVLLTPKEFSLLEELMQHEGRVLSRSAIAERIWGPAFEISSHVIAVHINNLRKKVDQGFMHSLIHTVTGVGYMLEDRGRL